MKRVRMEPLTVAHRGQALRVPGWQAVVPEMEDNDYTDALTRYLNALSPKLTATGARKLARARQHRMGEMAYRQKLQQFMRRVARRYATLYPERVASDGSLVGFQPEKIQAAFVPFNNTGRAGKRAISRYLQAFAEGGRR